ISTAVPVANNLDQERDKHTPETAPLKQDQESELVEKDLSIPSSEPTTNSLYQVNVSYLNVRSGPSMQSPVTRVLKQDEIVNAIGREGIWIRIGNTEYVSISYLRPASSSASH